MAPTAEAPELPRTEGRSRTARGRPPRALLLGALVPLMLLPAACAEGPREIQVGAEECAHCRMLISESPFAAQLLTDRGRGYVFDSIECMAEFLERGEEVAEERVRSLWVTDFTRPGTWVPAGEARFLRSERLRSPMGLGLTAYADEAAAAAHRSEHGGELLSWEGVRSLVAEAGVMDARPGEGRHVH